jgi:hypothetical protein
MDVERFELSRLWGKNPVLSPISFTSDNGEGWNRTNVFSFSIVWPDWY